LRILSWPEGAIVDAVGEIVHHIDARCLRGRKRRGDGSQIGSKKGDDAAIRV